MVTRRSLSAPRHGAENQCPQGSIATDTQASSSAAESYLPLAPLEENCTANKLMDSQSSDRHVSDASDEKHQLRARMSVPPLAMSAVGNASESDQLRAATKAEEISTDEGNTCTLRIVDISVNGLQSDNTLGLLLHGTRIVGFRIEAAKEVGWQIGDKIAEVNGQTVGTFEDFMDCFRDAHQKHGFPVQFNVIRGDQKHEAESTAEDTLRNFFSTADFEQLTGQLHEKLGEIPVPAEPNRKQMSLEGFLTPNKPDEPAASCSPEHPFVTALKLRRDALIRGNRGWAKWADDDFVDSCDSVASRLAQRQDGVSTLHVSRDEKKAGYTAPPVHKACSSWLCTPSNMVKGAIFEVVEHELAPSPHVEHYSSMDSRFDPGIEPPWITATTASNSRVSRDADIGRSAFAWPPERMDAAEDDSMLLAQLLVASGELNFLSDEEEDCVKVSSSTSLGHNSDGNADSSGYNAAGITKSFSMSQESDDFEFLLPRKLLEKDRACETTVEDKVPVSVGG